MIQINPLLSDDLSWMDKLIWQKIWFPMTGFTQAMV